MPVPAISDWLDLLIIVLVVVGAFALWLVSTALFIWGERRIVAFMQSRIGPNRLGPFGILQTLGDGIKLFFKEDIRPKSIDVVTYYAAPLLSATVAFLTFAVIPYGGTFSVGARTITLQVWDPPIGLLWVLAMGSIGVYGIVLGGWSSQSKYSLLGGVRSSAQMVSYELAMSLGAAAVFIYTGSLQASEIVAGQAGSLITDSIPVLRLVPAWNIIPMFPAFLLFSIAAVAEVQRPPFDLPEAEGELGAGFHTEYSAAKFAMFYLAEFMNTITMSALIVTMFVGGPNGPLFGPAWLQAILPTVWFAAKTFVFMFCFVWLRGTLPRLRYDRLMDLGWRVMLPLGVIWVFLTGFAVVVRDWARGNSGAMSTLLTWGGIVVLAGGFLFLVAPMFAAPDEPDEPDDVDEPQPDDVAEEVGV